MIRINLIRAAAHRPRKPKRKMNRSIAILLALPLLALGGFALWKLYGMYGTRLTALLRKPAQEAPRGPESVAHEEVPPTSFVSAQAVEDVIRDDVDSLAGDTSAAMQTVPYALLTSVEKINFERLFARTVCELFARTVPAGVDFRSMRADSFATFSAEGLSSSREQVAGVFTAVKAEDVIMLPRPYTEISPSGGGYHFSIACRADFGLDASSPSLVNIAELPAYEDLDRTVSGIRAAASAAGLALVRPPAQTDSWVDGDVRRFRYRLDGSGAYGEFVGFVAELVRTKEPCAFSSFSVNAVGSGAVRFGADLIVITRK